MIGLHFPDFLSSDALIVSGEHILSKVFGFENLPDSFHIWTNSCLLLWELLPAGCYGFNLK